MSIKDRLFLTSLLLFPGCARTVSAPELTRIPPFPTASPSISASKPPDWLTEVAGTTPTPKPAVASTSIPESSPLQTCEFVTTEAAVLKNLAVLGVVDLAIPLPGGGFPYLVFTDETGQIGVLTHCYCLDQLGWQLGGEGAVVAEGLRVRSFETKVDCAKVEVVPAEVEGVLQFKLLEIMTDGQIHDCAENRTHPVSIGFPPGESQPTDLQGAIEFLVDRDQVGN